MDVNHIELLDSVLVVSGVQSSFLEYSKETPNVKTFAKLNQEHSRGSRSPDNAEFGHLGS